MNALAVTLTVEQLGELVEQSVQRVLAASPPNPLPEVLDLKACAELLQLNPKTVTKLALHAGLPVHYLSEREPRFRRSEVLAWVSSRGRPGTAEVAA